MHACDSDWCQHLVHSWRSRQAVRSESLSSVLWRCCRSTGKPQTASLRLVMGAQELTSTAMARLLVHALSKQERDGKARQESEQTRRLLLSA